MKQLVHKQALAVVGAVTLLMIVIWVLAPSAAMNLKRTAVIEELDKGYLVRCQQAENPYPYRRISAATLTEASAEAPRCFEPGLGRPDRSGK